VAETTEELSTKWARGLAAGCLLWVSSQSGDSASISPVLQNHTKFRAELDIPTLSSSSVKLKTVWHWQFFIQCQSNFKVNLVNNEVVCDYPYRKNSASHLVPGHPGPHCCAFLYFQGDKWSRESGICIISS
jgi:hypothetical protein